jgi:Transmembrane domain of unknown function (DUF3566)
MNIPLGLVIEVLAFAAAAFVATAVRPDQSHATRDVVLFAIGCGMGAGALLFQGDVGLTGGILAPPFAGALLLVHVRVLEAVGVRVPTSVRIPPIGRLRAYATALTSTLRTEEPVQQPNPTTAPEPSSGFDPEPLPGEEELAPPLAPMPPEDGWPTTIVRPSMETRLPRRGARRTRVEVRRIGPFSVLKFSLIFYFCVFLVIYLALAIIWGILSASGAIDSLEELLGSIFPSGSGISPTNQISTRGAPPIEIDTGQVFTVLFIAGCIGVVIWSVINVFVAVMYNLISDIVGGVEVTLADRRD